jgi:uncharacterized protein (TIGR02271 family)
MQDIIAFYRSGEDARAAREELLTSGFDAGHIRTYDNASHPGQTGQAGTRTPRENEGFVDRIKEWFGFADENDRSLYGEATRRGNCSVTVSVPADSDRQTENEEAYGPGADRAVAILKRHNPVDLDVEANQWRSQGWQGIESGTAPQQQQTASRTQAGEKRLPVTEEQLRVGKQAIQQGGVRIHTRVTEKPVEEQVNLRTERVEVERRPANRPATDQDRAFQERVIEETAISEQPVVQKEARVVEEVGLRKDVQQRTETVRDKVRRTDVDVERMKPGQQQTTAGAARSAADDEGARCETFATELASDERYRGRNFNDIELEARRSYEQRNPGQTWERVKEKVREAFDRVRDRTRARR